MCCAPLGINFFLVAQVRSVTIPDVNPSEISSAHDSDGLPPFSMTAGDFLEVYTEPGTKTAKGQTEEYRIKWNVMQFFILQTLGTRFARFSLSTQPTTSLHTLKKSGTSLSLEDIG